MRQLPPKEYYDEEEYDDYDEDDCVDIEVNNSGISDADENIQDKNKSKNDRTSD